LSCPSFVHSTTAKCIQQATAKCFDKATFVFDFQI